MREVLFRVTRTLSDRAVRWWWAVVAGLGCGLTFLPLLGLPGYELSGALALLLTFVGGGLAVSAARRETHPVVLALLQLSAVVPALVLATAKTWLTSPCDPFSGVAFVPVLLIPSALLVAEVGALVAARTRRWWTSTLAWLGLVLLSAGWTAWPIVFGPQVFAFNHFGGYLPGPLYDEDLSVTAALLWFRLATVALAVGLAGWRLRRHGWAVAALGLALVLELDGVSLGFRMTDAALIEALGATTTAPHLIIHHGASLDPKRLAQLVDDVRFRQHQNARFFGAEPSQPTVVWWYASPDEKQRLVGAAHTQFSKPWRHEVHVNALGFPHPVIKHELVHAMAADWGSPPFGVAASFFGLLPHVGVIEGFAVAADNPIDDLSLHESAAAMKRKGLLPDVVALMGPQGFYGAPPRRAYTTAGSFLRFLAERRGPEALRALYRDGDFERAYGQPLSSLAQEYLTFLDGVPLAPSALNEAGARFHRPSLFDRPCAREVERLAARASALVGTDAAQAGRLLERCRALQPDEPAHALAEARVLRRLGKVEAATLLLDEALARLSKADSDQWPEAALERVDLAIAQGDDALAQRLLHDVLAARPGPAVDRTAHVRLEATPAVQRFFSSASDAEKIYALAHAAQTPRVRYLLARKLSQSDDTADALPLLEGLRNDEALAPSILQETARLGLEAAFLEGDCEALTRFADGHDFGPAFAARAADWKERCAWSKTAHDLQP